MYTSRRVVILRRALFARRRTYTLCGGIDAAEKVHGSFASKHAAQDDKSWEKRIEV